MAASFVNPPAMAASAPARARAEIVALDAVARRPRRLAVGVFDGVHVGHCVVIDGCDSVLTFDPAPAAHFARDPDVGMLTTVEQRAELVHRRGVPELIVARFDDVFADTSARAFIEQNLVRRLDARCVSVGADFRFGQAARGDTTLLDQYDAFETRVAVTVDHGGERVSSTRIRRLLACGCVEQAAELLGRHPELAGTLERGVDGLRFVTHRGQQRVGPGVYSAMLRSGHGDRPVLAVAEGANFRLNVHPRSPRNHDRRAESAARLVLLARR
jgi:hypothetical protein